MQRYAEPPGDGGMGLVGERAGGKGILGGLGG